MVTFRTYAAVWNWERRIYRLERIRLPMPVSFRWIGLFIGSLLLVVIPLNKLPLIAALPWPPLRYAVPPVLLANWLSKARLDGKPPLAWLQTVAIYLFMKKRWAAHRPMRLGGRSRFRVRVRMRAAGG